MLFLQLKSFSLLPPIQTNSAARRQRHARRKVTEVNEEVRHFCERMSMYQEGQHSVTAVVKTTAAG